MVSARPSTLLLSQQARFFAASSNLISQQERTQQLLPFTPNNLWDAPGARREKKRIGRGPGSGLGKTAGKGHKG